MNPAFVIQKFGVSLLRPTLVCLKMCRRRDMIHRWLCIDCQTVI